MACNLALNIQDYSIECLNMCFVIKVSKIKANMKLHCLYMDKGSVKEKR